MSIHLVFSVSLGAQSLVLLTSPPSPVATVLHIRDRNGIRAQRIDPFIIMLVGGGSTKNVEINQGINKKKIERERRKRRRLDLAEEGWCVRDFIPFRPSTVKAHAIESTGDTPTHPSTILSRLL